MNVELKNHWFDGAELRAPGIQVVPDHLRDILPSTSVILDDKNQPDEKANEAKAEKQLDLAKDVKDQKGEVKPSGSIDKKGDIKL